MNIEHFIYALYPKLGIKLSKSSGIDKLLNANDLYYLCHIGDKLETSGLLWWTNNRIFAFTKIEPLTDEYGRHGVWNHTLIIPIGDYISLTHPLNFLAFMPRQDKPPGKLEPLQIADNP